MSRLSRLVGKPVEVNLEGEVLSIMPLKMKDLGLLLAMDNKNPEVQQQALTKLMQKTLKTAVPDATDEEIENMALTYFQPLSDAIMKANGMDPGKNVDKRQDTKTLTA